MPPRASSSSRRAGEGSVRRIDPAALDLLCRHSWPGNVRELRNVIERAVVTADGDAITMNDLPERVRGGVDLAPSPTDDEADADFKDRVRRYETDLILDALRRAGGNQTEAAKILRMPLRTLVHKLHAYGLKKMWAQDGES